MPFTYSQSNTHALESSSLYPLLRMQSRIYPCACSSSKVSQASSSISKCIFHAWINMMHYFSRAFIVKCHRLGDLNKRNLFSFVLRVRSPKSTCWACRLLHGLSSMCVSLVYLSFLQKHQSYWIKAPFSWTNLTCCCYFVAKSCLTLLQSHGL